MEKPTVDVDKAIEHITECLTKLYCALPDEPLYQHGLGRVANSKDEMTLFRKWWTDVRESALGEPARPVPGAEEPEEEPDE